MTPPAIILLNGTTSSGRHGPSAFERQRAGLA